MQAVNPATGEVVGEYEAHDEAAVAERLARAAETATSWADRPITERASLLADAATELRENREDYAATATAEMGKPITQARVEVEKCAWVCEHYAERAAEYLAPEEFGVEPAAEARVVYEPLGPVLAVMPWNFPYWQVFRFAAPALAAGNVGLLKHASSVPGCALAIEEVFERAGFPAGAFQALLIDSGRVEDVIEDDRIAAATLTGSGPAGSAVAGAAGSHLKKTVLELGGSDPFVVLPDADLAATAQAGAWARAQNGGQSCIAAKRFVVHEAVYEAFLDALVEALDGLVVGDPTDEDTDVGPMVDADQRRTVHEQVEASVEAGATLELGGEPLEREGAYYPPTVLTDVPEGCPADSEEVFGPIAAVYRVPDVDAAVERANDTRFGLGGSVWTADPERGERVARRIEAGCVFVNELVKSDPRVPFGGIAESGYGRELSRVGIREFTNRKTVWVRGAPTTDSVPDGTNLAE